MANTLRNLPDNFLYESLVPPAVANLDTRGLMMALIAGWQDRIADFRSTADRFADLINPAPEAYTCVLATYTAEPGGNNVTATLDVTSDTPEDEADLASWAAEQLDIEEERVISAVMGTDALRTVGIDTMQYLAASLGAFLYPGLPGEDPTVVLQRQKEALTYYFPRLKLKGTPESFSILARLAGFSDGSLVPLWPRLSPRNPADPGNSVNEGDFRAKPDIFPMGQMAD